MQGCLTPVLRPYTLNTASGADQNVVCGGPGVIAVAVFGLYGAATSKFDISAKLEESGAFEAFWDTFAFVTNGVVFFFAGASSVNFVIRRALPAAPSTWSVSGAGERCRGRLSGAALPHTVTSTWKGHVRALASLSPRLTVVKWQPLAAKAWRQF